MQACKGVCLKYENYPQAKRNGRLPIESKSFPYCSTCQTVIKTDSKKCPCCHTLLSWKRINVSLGECKIVQG